MQSRKPISKRYGLRIPLPLANKLEEYLDSIDIATGKPVREDMNAQDVIKQAIKEFLERHLK